MSRLALVATAERPDLAATTGRWRWEAFFRDDGPSLETMLDIEYGVALADAAMPRTLVLLEDDAPVAMASLAARDLDERPDLTPWLAGVYVLPTARGRGHARRVVAGVEAHAALVGISTLWLYTRTAERLYAGIGWRTHERFARGGRDTALMRRDLTP